MNAIGQMGASISGAINSALGGVGQGMAALLRRCSVNPTRSSGSNWKSLL